jgi:integrase
MKRNNRWPTNLLEDMPKFKGDDTPTRKRAILGDEEFEKLLSVTKIGPERRNLTGEQRYFAYLISAMTGLRAAEVNSLRPSSFHLDAKQPFVRIHCTVSKRRLTDELLLRQDFAQLLKPWLVEHMKLHGDLPLFYQSASWANKAATMLRADLKAAGIDDKRGDCVIDFHSFRALRVTKCLLSGKSSRVVMQTVRLSSEALLARYAKIPLSEVAECVDAVPMPTLT